MRKLLTISFILALFFLLLHNETSTIRVRVIPKDNLKESLVVKEEVIKITIDFLEEQYDSNYKKYINNIKNNINIYNNKVKQFNAYGTLEYHTFYDKTYNGNSLKNETVLTFLVKIDEASGDNWWGTIYPEFLDMSSEEEVEYEWYIVKKLKEWFG